jgi:hypothetical protein
MKYILKIPCIKAFIIHCYNIIAAGKQKEYVISRNNYSKKFTIVKDVTIN